MKLRQGLRNRSSSSDSDCGISSDEGIRQYSFEDTREFEKNSAPIPDYIPESERNLGKYETRQEFHCWSPANGLEDNAVANILSAATEYGFNEEQALAMLHFNESDVPKTIRDFKNFKSRPNRWTFKEKEHFCFALLKNGKDFRLIKNYLQNNSENESADKSISEIVLYYYQRKVHQKGRKRTRRKKNPHNFSCRCRRP